VLFLVAPDYMDMAGVIRAICVILALLCSVVAMIGSGVAVQKLFKHEAFGFFGVAAVFLVPSAFLFAWVHLGEPSSPWLGLAKFGALLLVAFGGGIAIYGASLFLDAAPATSNRKKSTQAKGKDALRSVNAAVVGLTGLATAVIGLISALQD